MKTPGRVSELAYLVEQGPDGDFTARALGESIFTEADDVTSLHDRVGEAVRRHFEVDRVPRVRRLHFVREEIVSA